MQVVRSDDLHGHRGSASASRRHALTTFITLPDCFKLYMPKPVACARDAGFKHRSARQDARAHTPPDSPSPATSSTIPDVKTCVLPQ